MAQQTTLRLETLLEFTTVKVGSFEFEGLRDPERKEFRVALQQARRLLLPSASPSNMNKYLRRALGQDYELIQYRTNRSVQNNYENTLNLNQFRRLVAKLAYRGHGRSREINDLLIGVSLEEKFRDAFNLHSSSQEAEERKEIETEVARSNLEEILQKTSSVETPEDFLNKSKSELLTYLLNEKKEMVNILEESIEREKNIESIELDKEVAEQELDEVYQNTEVFHAMSHAHKEHSITVNNFAKTFKPQLKSGLKPPQDLRKFMQKYSKNKRFKLETLGRDKLFLYLRWKTWCLKNSKGGTKASSYSVDQGWAANRIIHVHPDQPPKTQMVLLIPGCQKLTDLLREDGYELAGVHSSETWEDVTQKYD
jgi:hypothetical protein